MLSKQGLGTLFVSFFYCVAVAAQSEQNPWVYEASTQVSFASNRNPFWLNANKYGLSSVRAQSAYIRAKITRQDEFGKWHLDYRADIAGAIDHTSGLIIQQLYGEAQYKKVRFAIGSKERPLELKNDELSSGSMTLGINSRPVPQVRVELPDYWQVTPWLGLKGHVAYGWFTDGKWQENYQPTGSRYVRKALYHSKSGYLHFGNEERFPLSGTLGLEMATQFGGTIYNLDATHPKVELDHGLKAFWNAFFSGGNDPTDGVYANNSGNMLGSWIADISYKFPTWKVRAYYDHFFEDHSGLFMLGSGGWNADNTKQSRHFTGYKLKDGLWGVEVTLPKNRFVSDIVYEYLYTKYQSGPLYHDHTAQIPDEVGGKDGYYSHNLYLAWAHWGQVIGNPLITSPIYNKDRVLQIRNNRLFAHHIGFRGNPTDRLHYRFLLTYSENWGSYFAPFKDKKYNTSILCEVSYSLPKDWQITSSFGIDRGNLLDNNVGLQIGLSKRGLF